MSDEVDSDEIKYLEMIERARQRNRPDDAIWQQIDVDVSKLQLLQSNFVNVLFYHVVKYILKPINSHFEACIDSLYNLFGNDSKSCMRFIHQIENITKTEDGMVNFMDAITAVFPRYV